MLSNFKKTISAANLGKGSLCGQTATLMILIIVFILSLILLTLNIGQVGLKGTKLANAADTASLSLASQLASKAKLLGENLGSGTFVLAKCKKGGILGTVLAVIGALIAIAISPFCGGMSLIALAAIGGMIGGMIGGALTSNNPLTGGLLGAVQGAAIGASMGYAFGASAAYPGCLWAESFSGMSATGLALGSLTVAGTIFNAAMTETDSATAFRSITRQLNGLSEESRIRETVLFSALSQTVEDPNKTDANTVWYAKGQWQDSNGVWQHFDGDTPLVGPNPFDAELDGNTQKKVSKFVWWWDQRVRAIKEDEGAAVNAAAYNFVNGPLKNFYNNVLYPARCGGGSLWRGDTDGGSDGSIIRLLRRMYNKNIRISFGGTNWLPGPGYTDYQAWINSDCNDDSCDTSLAGFDYLDNTISDIDELSSFYRDIISDPNYLKANWQSLAAIFYYPDPGDDYYHNFQKIKTDMAALKENIRQARDILPSCTYKRIQYGEESAWRPTNVPCKIDTLNILNLLGLNGIGVNNGSYAGVIDDSAWAGLSDPEYYQYYFNNGVYFGPSQDHIELDQITPAIKKVNQIINNIDPFLQGCQDFYDKLNPTLKVVINPVRYAWQDMAVGGDTPRNHYVIVRFGPYRTARIVRTKSGNFLFNKTCLRLSNYQDVNGEKTWVRIIRGDESNKVGNVGTWNPTNDLVCDSNGICYAQVSRISRARYKLNGTEFDINISGLGY